MKTLDPKLDFHPAAAIFPMMSDKEIDKLAESIKKHGQQVTAIRIDGKIADGRNRAMACQRAGVKLRVKDFEPDNLTGFLGALNLDRRHLTASQKRVVLAAMLKAMPKITDRKAAKAVGASKNTAAAVREELEEEDEIEPADEREGEDGKKYRGKRKSVGQNDQLDSLGNPIPVHLREVFSVSGEWIAEGISGLDSNMRRLEIICRSLEDLARKDKNPHLHSSAFVNAMSLMLHNLRLAKQALQAAKPYAVCQSCKGDGCAKCKQCGWTPFDLTPRS